MIPEEHRRARLVALTGYGQDLDRAMETPLLVDPLYARNDRVDARALGLDDDAAIGRLTLHAAALEVPRPDGSGRLRVEAPLADDLAAFVAALTKARAAAT